MNTLSISGGLSHDECVISLRQVTCRRGTCVERVAPRRIFFWNQFWWVRRLLYFPFWEMRYDYRMFDQYFFLFSEFRPIDEFSKVFKKNRSILNETEYQSLFSIPVIDAIFANMSNTAITSTLIVSAAVTCWFRTSCLPQVGLSKRCDVTCHITPFTLSLSRDAWVAESRNSKYSRCFFHTFTTLSLSL